ncbi:ATP-binding protein [Chondromyces crocatus]|uniref:histidine kinase n=1 Tax=Chondromyces crocatus TaxID=52 RepID=A0A0K1E7I7_CHOCO|nr:ATP-binding protein [Chondromyces crocatus]AKT36824.1 ATPase [Chondromyces crocatus]
MALSDAHLLAAALGYVAVLFLLAHAAERGRLPAGLARHPLTYVLSLGIYASSWTYFGSVGVADQHGLDFLAISLGPTLACLAIPAIWLPVLRLARAHQLSTLADLFAFRYPSRLTGAVVALFSLLASVPYIAQQIRGIVDSARALAPEHSIPTLGLLVTALLALFTVLFGARHVTPRERHAGLAVAMAFASLLKLGALLAVGALALWGVFGGTAGLSTWLTAHPEAWAAQLAPVRRGTSWMTLLLLSFGAAFLLPRQYHVAFAEGPPDRSLLTAGWGFPLYLLLINLPLLPILWAGREVAPGAPADVLVLAVPRALGSVSLSLLGFVGGVAAASAMAIVTTIALAAMTLNHLVLPARIEVLQRDAYARLLWLRRGLIAAIVVAGYGLYLLEVSGGPLVQPGLVSFVAFAQLLPGLFGLLFWQRASRQGFLAGLGAGALAWIAMAMLPLVSSSHGTSLRLPAFGDLYTDSWTPPTVVSLSLNVTLFAIVSLLTRQGDAEVEAARRCAREGPAPQRGAPATSAAELTQRLARSLGESAAQAEVERAVQELDLEPGDLRPAEQRQLRERVEQNLSGLLGPVLARMVVDQGADTSPGEDAALADQLRFLEERLGQSGSPLQGTAAQLDVLRRYLRSVLEGLPLGVCALGPDHSVILWNRALGATTTIAGEDAVGLPIERVEAPWGEVLGRLVATGEQGVDEIAVQTRDGQRRSLRVHRAELARSALPGSAPAGGSGGMVLLVEDRTEREALQAQLIHHDRLASMGRLAAGMAHEIGNPLTGITCLAQNLEEETDSPDTQERARMIVEQAMRISAIVRSLKTFSQTGTSSIAPGPPGAPGAPGHVGEVASARVGRVELAAVVDDAIRFVRLDRAAKQVQLENLCPEGLLVLGERQQLTQVFVNLLTNARDASTAGAQVVVTAQAEETSVLAQVIDHGVGLSQGLQTRVFEPFFTTKDPAEGTGLGLSLVYSIVREHGGDVVFESQEGIGTTVTVRLPLHAARHPENH